MTPPMEYKFIQAKLPPCFWLYKNNHQAQRQNFRPIIIETPAKLVKNMFMLKHTHTVYPYGRYRHMYSHL